MRFPAPAGLAASIALATVLGPIGCATAPARPASEGVKRRNDIEVAEIRSAPDRLLTAADLVRVLRPEMLTSRDRTSSRTIGAINPIQVYVDGVPNGGHEALVSVPASAVVRLQRLTPVEASSRYGGSHPGGVILVTTLSSLARP
jgi:hypothetical protein